MAFRMSGLTRTKSGAYRARIGIPKDVRDDYEALYGKRWEEPFHAPADCPLSEAKMRHSDWEGQVVSRIAALRAKHRGEGHDLTQREARALAGEWYRWFVGQHDENPGEPSRWDRFHKALWHLLELVAGDDETGEIDMEAPEVREEIHPKLADEAETAQFLATKGEVLTPAARTLFLDAVLHEFLEATDVLQRRASGDYSPIEQWNLHLGAAFNKAYYVSYPHATAAVLVGGFITQGQQNWGGYPLPRAPEWTANLGSDYTYPLPMGNLNLALSVSYSSSYVPVSDSYDPASGALFFKQGAYALTNGTVTWNANDHFWLGVYSNNMFNRRYRIYYNYNTFGAYDSENQPVTYGLKVGINY